MEHKNIMDYETVDLDLSTKELLLIDQTLLPAKTEILRLSTAKEIWEAIYLLKVRGAPAIGVAAAFGIYILATQIKAQDFETFYSEFTKQKEYLDSSRPTAVNLSWALNRMDQICLSSRTKPLSVILDLLLKEALNIKKEDTNVCRMIGEYGLTLLQPGDGILTHCNAGQLATSKYGTATAPIYLGHERGYGFRVFADETRPLLQGARLTAYELHSSGVDVTLICDNMASMVMKNGWINAVFVGCDRVAANGDTANKIGTSGVAALAAYYKIPFYVCAPTSTIDLSLEHGGLIPIEERKSEEITHMWYETPMAPQGVKTYNPAFDVTDHTLITGIITEYGIARAPYEKSFLEIFAKKRENYCNSEDLLRKTWEKK